jgi:Mn2+/Fe2+ NRAMP family transporter
MFNALKKLLRILGPGIITGAADDDPSGIATYLAEQISCKSQVALKLLNRWRASQQRETQCQRAISMHWRDGV